MFSRYDPQLGVIAASLAAGIMGSASSFFSPDAFILTPETLFFIQIVYVPEGLLGIFLLIWSGIAQHRQPELRASVRGTFLKGMFLLSLFTLLQTIVVLLAFPPNTWQNFNPSSLIDLPLELLIIGPMGIIYSLIYKIWSTFRSAN